MAATPARRDGLDVQNLDDQRVAALCAAYFEWPCHGISSTNRRARQIDQLAYGVDEHRAAPRILCLEHHRCTRVDGQHRLQRRIVEVADLVAWDAFGRHGGTHVALAYRPSDTTAGLEALDRAPVV